MTARRRTLWAKARAFDVAEDPSLSPRARRLAQRAAAAALTFDDLVDSPEWAAWTPEAQARLAQLAGAVAVAAAWRRSVDGALLRRAGEVLGEALLDAVLALPDDGLLVDDAAARDAEPEALSRLGRAALLGELADRPVLASRLGRPTGALPWPAIAPAAATARGLYAQIGAA